MSSAEARFSPDCRYWISRSWLFIQGSHTWRDLHGVERCSAERRRVRPLLDQCDLRRPIIQQKDPGGTASIAPYDGQEYKITVEVFLLIGKSEVRILIVMCRHFKLHNNRQII